MPSLLHETMVTYAEMKVPGMEDGVYTDCFKRKRFRKEMIKSGFDDEDLSISFIPDSYQITEDKIIIIEANITTLSPENNKVQKYTWFWFEMDSIYPETEVALYFIDASLMIQKIDLMSFYYASLKARPTYRTKQNL